MRCAIGMAVVGVVLALGARGESFDLPQAPNSWVKRSPLPNTPRSPRLGYEGACAWDSRHHCLIRYAGHNQGGGGEQHAELWTFDLFTAKWTLKEPNTSPLGVCCGQQNVFDPIQGRYIRFPSFSGSHGWQWWRDIYLNDTSAWTYDLASNTWRNMRPLPTTQPGPLRCASWDSDHQVVVIFGGEGNSEGTVVYDPYANTWTQMEPSVQPAFRSGGNMAYDAARQRHILFGSQFSNDPHTWSYDLRKNQWEDVKPPAMPPTDQNDAVLTYDAANQVIVAIVKITEGKDEAAKHRLETWLYDADANRWTKANPEYEPNATGNRARVLVYAPEYKLTVLENRTHGKGLEEQQIWTYRSAASKAPSPALPEAPTELSVTTSGNGVTLNWKPSATTNLANYLIFRGTGQKPWQVDYQKIATLGADQTNFQDTGLKSDTTYYYYVRAADNAGRPSPPSVKVRTAPRIVEDAVVSVISAKEVEVRWNPAEEKDVVGYNVERAVVEVYTEAQLKRLSNQTEPLAQPSVGALHRIGQFQRLNTTPVTVAMFKDTTVDLSTLKTVEPEKPVFERSFRSDQLLADGKPYRFAVYAYRIRAVNRLAIESGPSPAFLTIPSAPQNVFSKEAGRTCQLKWAANPEQGLHGYRVYRMNGRYDKDPIVRLTLEPGKALTYDDAEAGRGTRRYHVVAVDALGQEGFPSSPVWFDREWKQYYQPFTTEWHQ